MKHIRTAALLTLIALAPLAKGQDTISMRTGDVIVANVSNVGVTEITYKKWGRSDGPTYNILKSDVAYIKYPDGTKDEFKTAPAPLPAPAPVISPYVNPYSFTNIIPTSYTMTDSTVSSMPKLRLTADVMWGNLLDFSGLFNASYYDFDNSYMLGAYASTTGTLGAEGTYYLIKGKNKQMTNIPFTYQYGDDAYTYTTIQHNVEKINYLGLHAAYSLRSLSDANFAWWSYYHNFEDNSYTSPTGQTFNPLGKAPMYDEIDFGPQYVHASRYKAQLNDGSGMSVAHEVITTVGLDVLVYPRLPSLGATYDSIAAIQANKPTYDSFDQFPSSNFSDVGYRFYFKMQFGFNTGNTDWGFDWQASFEQNLSGFGYAMGMFGIYVAPK